MHLHEALFFLGFLTAIMIFLYIDLKVAGKNDHELSFKEAATWTSIWVVLALLFFLFLRFYGDIIHGVEDKAGVQSLIDRYSHSINISSSSITDLEALRMYRNTLSLEYITGYLIEYSLSIDNVFVMILIFTGFGIQKRYYKRILFWGILGAIIMRFIFIFLSSTLIQHFEWILYLFGAFLVFTGIQMFLERNKEQKIHTYDHPVVKFASRFFQVKKDYQGQKFIVKENGKYLITPLLIVLLVIEFSDLVFAVDSVPAIFAVTKDPYIVFFSNIFAILGLRSLFFVVANVMNKFSYLKEGLAILLTFIGVKMIIVMFEVKIPTNISLLVVLGIIALSIVFSLLFPKKARQVH
ncbi:MAG: TerC/Alx family metal homeostasis membrane protein [Bacteroidales bacterium]